jgi:hypothetical protein
MTISPRAPSARSRRISEPGYEHGKLWRSALYRVVRINVDRELRVGDRFNLLGRDWIVSTVRAGDKEGLDRRLVAREAIEAA